MRYYIEDSDGRVVGKFDGPTVELETGHEKHEVDTVTELSEIKIDEWFSAYDPS